MGVLFVALVASACERPEPGVDSAPIVAGAVAASATAESGFATVPDSSWTGIGGPAIIAFYPVASNDQLAADEGLAAALADVTGLSAHPTVQPSGSCSRTRWDVEPSSTVFGAISISWTTRSSSSVRARWRRASGGGRPDRLVRAAGLGRRDLLERPPRKLTSGRRLRVRARANSQSIEARRAKRPKERSRTFAKAISASWLEVRTRASREPSGTSTGARPAM